MSDLGVDYDALEHARDHVSTITDRLRREQRDLHVSLDSFLDDEWTGQAATEFRSAFGDWSQGAETVLAGLGAASVLIEGAKRTLETQDENVGLTMTRLHGRLGQGPGQ